MIRRIRLPHVAAALFALSALAATPLGVASAEAAVVYCKTVGVPRVAWSVRRRLSRVWW
jgi:hypothetical protein